MTHGGMDFRVLGPVGAWRDGTEIRLTAPKHRAVLAAGLLAANHVVPMARLVEAVWADDPPASATSVIQTYIYELRRALRHAGAGPLIQTRPPGYIFAVPAGALDLFRFEALVAEGRAAAARGEDRRAVVALRSALDLWRGPALADMDTPVLRNEAVRLEAMRLATLEERYDVELRLGPLNAPVPELVSLVAAHPFRERFRGQLMLALHRLGRTPEALEVYQQGRVMLRDELGLDPGSALRQLYAQILADAPGLSLADTGVRVTAAAEPSVPNQLPAPQARLIGRDRPVAALCAVLDAGKPPDRPVVSAIAGGAGTGTTALALFVAHRVRAAYPDGQLFASFADVGRAIPAERVVASFLRALLGPATAVPNAYTEACALLRGELARRRVLVLLDDVESEAQVRDFLPATGGSALLVVSRPRLSCLEPISTVDLGPLGTEEALALLAHLIGSARVLAEPRAARAIVGYCDRLPLALRIAGARLAARPAWPLSVLGIRLSDPRRRLAELVAGDLSVRRSLDRTYRRLDRAERFVLRTLAASARPAMTASALAPTIGVDISEAERIADALVGHRLLEQAEVNGSGQVRYSLTGLNLLYAAERTGVRLAGAALDIGWTGAGARSSTVLGKRR